MKIALKIILIIAILISSITPVVGNQSVLIAGCGEPYAYISILEANYGDVDGDGFADDVFSIVQLDLFCANRYQFDYYVYLTLPSGFQVYDILSISAKIDTLTFNTTFYNYALEDGDYSIDVIVLLMNQGPTVTTESIVFDPPGGVSGTGSVKTTITT